MEDLNNTEFKELKQIETSLFKTATVHSNMMSKSNSEDEISFDDIVKIESLLNDKQFLTARTSHKSISNNNGGLVIKMETIKITQCSSITKTDQVAKNSISEIATNASISTTTTGTISSQKTIDASMTIHTIEKHTTTSQSNGILPINTTKHGDSTHTYYSLSQFMKTDFKSKEKESLSKLSRGTLQSNATESVSSSKKITSFFSTRPDNTNEIVKPSTSISTTHNSDDDDEASYSTKIGRSTTITGQLPMHRKELQKKQKEYTIKSKPKAKKNKKKFNIPFAIKMDPNYQYYIRMLESKKQRDAFGKLHCAFCEPRKEFNLDSGLHRHYIEQHYDKCPQNWLKQYFECETCDRSFKRAEHYKQHCNSVEHQNKVNFEAQN